MDVNLFTQDATPRESMEMRDLRNAGDRTALGYGFAVTVGCGGPRDGKPDG
jgi:hypothetical protein